MQSCTYHTQASLALVQVVAQTPTAPEELARLEAQQAAEAAEYERLKAELQAWCLATAFLCSVATLAFYSKVRCSRAYALLQCQAWLQAWCLATG